ncbi:flagellar motor switch phosphatase FliY [uncultured Clostridium sp.]|uniref:flagellar motor switch phosphatase FliY n=1 Tax=uncultured Clostridium sp. TaxID=59620 RepID=UPI0032167F31
MDNSFLSQEEIDVLLNGDGSSSESEPVNEPAKDLSDLEKDLLGEVGNISMGTAATALSAVVGKPVNITTPTITISTLNKLKKSFKTPNIVLDVQFVSGIVGGNLFIINIIDSAVIANLMMGGDGVLEPPSELSELEISAVQEAMNQMIGSAATSMATMFSREVNISPPISSVCDENSEEISTDITADEEIVNVSFRMTIGDLVDSNIVQILPIATAKKIVSIMMGTEDEVAVSELTKVPAEVEVVAEPKEIYINNEDVANETASKETYNNETTYSVQGQGTVENRYQSHEDVNVKQATFGQLEEIRGAEMPKNIDLILDVPLELSVELGRTKKNIRDILALTRGSLIELNKLAEEPVDIFINGKRIAHGEVVVVDENFGVKITEIASGEDRVKSLSK